MPIMHSLYPESATVRIDPSTCNQCGACAKICGGEVLAMVDGKIHIQEDSLLGCIACGHCMMTCPEGAISVAGRGISPDDLLPLPPRENRANADQLTALMQSRRSVRRFKDREVDPELLERIVEMAASAPMGIPPWDIGCVTLRGRNEVQRLAEEVVKGYEGFLKLFKPWLLTMMRPFVGKAKYTVYADFVLPLAKTYVQNHRDGRDLVFHSAPALLIFHHSPYAEPADAIIACTYAMLAAESMGLGSTMIGGAPPILQRDKALCQRLGIPSGNIPAISLILGHPATHFRHAVKRRFSSLGTVGP